MTLVDADTGEVVALDASAAERRAERITLRLDAIADNYRAVLPMIREAIEKRDDLALGYRSPGDYISDRFGQSLAGLGIEVRRSVVHELTEAGMSTRAIAPVVGVSHPTVIADQRSGGKGLPPEPDEAPEVEPRFKKSQQPKPDPKPVTGKDGKSYPATPKTPAKPRRSSLPDAASKAGWELRKAIERVERICADDRFPSHREQVAAALRSHLSYVAEVMPDLIDATHQSQED